MFTGIVQTLGKVEFARLEPPGRRLAIRWPNLGRAELNLGESVAVNGCCLTVVESRGEVFMVQAGPETLNRTNIGRLAAGDLVNLERALSMGDRLGGHIVQGHVDTMATLRSRRPENDWDHLIFETHPEWTELMVPKGSITLDGVSLTLVDVGTVEFSVMLIPHTLQVTTLGRLPIGGQVNLETDILARHVRKLFQAWMNQSGKSGATTS